MGTFRFIQLPLPVVSLLVLLLVSSCMKDRPETFPGSYEWNPDLAIPLSIHSLGMNAESGFDTLLLHPDTLTGFPDWAERPSFSFSGTTLFNLSQYTNETDYIRLILFRFNLWNGFPEDARVQVYFINNQGDPLDSLFTGGAILIVPGTVQDTGSSVTPSYRQEEVLFGQDRIQALRDTREILYRTVIVNTSLDSSLIEFYPGYRFHVQAGMNIGLRIDL